VDGSQSDVPRSICCPPPSRGVVWLSLPRSCLAAPSGPRHDMPPLLAALALPSCHPLPTALSPTSHSVCPSRNLPTILVLSLACHAFLSLAWKAGSSRPLPGPFPLSSLLCPCPSMQARVLLPTSHHHRSPRCSPAAVFSLRVCLSATPLYALAC